MTEVLEICVTFFSKIPPILKLEVGFCLTENVFKNHGESPFCHLLMTEFSRTLRNIFSENTPDCDTCFSKIWQILSS